MSSSTPTPPPYPPRVSYTHRVPFSAVRTERGPDGTQELIGHSYVAEFLFEAPPDAGDEAIGLVSWETTRDALQVIDTWVAQNLRGNLDRMEFVTTPHGIAWYLFDALAQHAHLTVDLQAITITVGNDSYTLRPGAAQ